MTDFLSSMTKGIKAAQEAEAAKRQIRDVFQALNTQLRELIPSATIKLEKLQRKPRNDKLTIGETLRRSGAILGGTGFAGGYGFSKKDDEIEGPPYEAIVLRVSKKNFWELAEWKQADIGFPCVIVNASARIVCETKVGLETGLSTLLSSPSAGVALIEAKAAVPAERKDSE